MNDLAAPFRQLVERRLWPLALILLGALAAVFLVLSKGEEPAPIPIAAATAPTTPAAAETTPIVTLGDPAVRDARRKVLGARKNPFQPTVKGKKAKTSTAEASKPAVAGGAGLPKTDEAIANAINGLVGVQGLEKKKTYELYSLHVRFGDSMADKLNGRNLRRLTSLPNSTEPVAIYLGLLDDHKTAVFLVDATAKVLGDGKCMPKPENCQTLQMKAGETAFFDVVDETGTTTKQYQLDLVRVRVRKTTDAKAAKRSYASTAKGGRDALRARQSRLGNMKYDAASGVVRSASR